MTVPLFARDFPKDAALDSLVGAFDRGDFGHIRVEAPKVIASAKDPKVREAAETLLARTKPDPLALVFYVLTLALVTCLSVYWWWRSWQAGMR